MDVAWPVDADTDEKVVLAKKLAPFVVEQSAVGLQGVFKGHARPAVFVLKLDGAPVEIDAHEGWFSALPGNGYRVAAMGRDELGDVSFQNLIAHAKATSGIELVLFEIKTIRAIQVAGRSGRFDQNVYAWRKCIVGHGEFSGATVRSPSERGILFTPMNWGGTMGKGKRGTCLRNVATVS